MEEGESKSEQVLPTKVSVAFQSSSHNILFSMPLPSLRCLSFWISLFLPSSPSPFLPSFFSFLPPHQFPSFFLLKLFLTPPSFLHPFNPSLLYPVLSLLMPSFSPFLLFFLSSSVILSTLLFFPLPLSATHTDFMALVVYAAG